jgi:hypothetical protein
MCTSKSMQGGRTALADALSADPEEARRNVPPSTAPASMRLSLSGSFASEEAARQFGNHVAELIGALSRFMDLERLDGITIADDYDGALARLDRGFKANRPLSRSNDERIVGVAMAAPVLRNGVAKSHLVFYRPAITAITDEADTEAKRDALYTIAHECGHVADRKAQDEAFPGVLLALDTRRLDVAMIYDAAVTLWEEYAACRASAGFAYDRQVAHYVIALSTTLAGARERSNASIRAYRVHGDLDRLLREAPPHVAEPLRMYAYLLGTLDGHERTLEEAAPHLVDAIAQSAYEAAFEHAAAALRGLWDSRGTWTGQHVFDPLCAMVRLCLQEAGIIFHALSDGRVSVDVPFSPETLPSEYDRA